MGFHGVMSSDSGMPIKQLGVVKFRCADKNGVSKDKIDVSGLDGGIGTVIESGILSEFTLEDRSSDEPIGTVIGGGILSTFTFERNDTLTQEEEEAAERERIREERRKQEEE